MRTALLIVDMLNDFVDGVLANPAAKALTGPIGALAEQARAADDWVVVYANDAHQLGDVELRVFPPHAMAGSTGAAVVDELHPGVEDLVVPKRFYSAFTDTTLRSVLRAHDVGRLALVGQHTDCCVRHTAYDAFAQGYELVVCPDATTVFEPGGTRPVAERQQAALEYLHTYYGVRLESSTTVD